MVHELLKTWFEWVENWGYLGVFLLMAMESSILPVPSEIVMPPAAFWASQGKMSFAGIIFMGAAGSYAGSALSYWVSRWAGIAFIRRYGKYFFLSQEKLKLAEVWVGDFEGGGVFAARLLPVIRHLISIPAGILEMPFLKFSVMTILGATLWCTVLAWFGGQVIGGHPELLSSPEAMMAVIKSKLHWFIAAVFILTVLYGFVIWFKKKGSQVAAT